MIDTVDALYRLIAVGESLTLELKKSTAEKDRACRSLCAMANGRAGKWCLVLPHQAKWWVKR